jgi:hypothetical protein
LGFSAVDNSPEGSGSKQSKHSPPDHSLQDAEACAAFLMAVRDIVEGFESFRADPEAAAAEDARGGTADGPPQAELEAEATLKAEASRLKRDTAALQEQARAVEDLSIRIGAGEATERDLDAITSLKLTVTERLATLREAE